MIPYGKQDITDKDIQAVTDVLRSDFLTQGPKIAEFEKIFAEYIGVKYAVAVANGTAALHLSVLALGIKPLDNVITTPISFAASANCVRYGGGNVFFSDIDPITYTLDLIKVEQLILSKPQGFFQGIIPVDFAGFAINLKELKDIANKYGLWIIEDACHAPGGYFVDSSGTKQFSGNGKFSDLSIFSFHPVKHIACGEGGMITTNNEKLFKKLILLRTHGITKDSDLLHENHGSWYYELQELGFNYRLTDFQAALGTSQLHRAEERLIRRREIASVYQKNFQDKSFIKGQSGITDGHAYHLYVIEVEDRLGLYNYLRTKNIFAQVHYIPIHLMPYYKNFGWKNGDMPVAENYYKHCLSLPMFPKLSDEEQQFVIKSIFDFYSDSSIL